ncbi:hypothetical protein SAMN04488030_3133 [Aliiroseovarius halocynthiae]|uniref:Lipoprotein n=1 Tax=Aliiroseovarius halocynthiae TaxID=985055 RepID=A0A545SM57_9RHOB|nr:hypothetical protein [Aliiroseovarius halocynthiae]TQV66070.1 hypothetical protein FIL88_14985 [Aliiroseovarius halocynthiae]SMR83219.1 hypothetical protein SAMN04488030_3133 [Aliiroseovarius halocynthiae]
MSFLRHIPLAAVTSLAVLSGCNLHREASLRGALERYFTLGDTLSFNSKLTCTAAVFRAALNDVKPDMPLASTSTEAQELFRDSGKAALRVDGQTPHALTDKMLATEDGAFGRQALAAAALVGRCLSDADSQDFFRALTRPGATIAYDTGVQGVMVLDPLERKLFFAAGDPL